MKLYVCWGTFPVPWPRRGAPWEPRYHPCKVAHDALKSAGYSPTVVRVYGFRGLPDITRGRREVKRLSGDSVVPVLILDTGEIVRESKQIAAWAHDHPATRLAERGQDRR